MVTATLEAMEAPKTLAEMQAESNGSEPWACSGCGCKDWRVVDSRFIDADPRFDGFAKRRVRVCRNCRRILPSGPGTLEVAVPDGFKITLSPIETQNGTSAER